VEYFDVTGGATAVLTGVVGVAINDTDIYLFIYLNSSQLNAALHIIQ